MGLVCQEWTGGPINMGTRLQLRLPRSPLDNVTDVPMDGLLSQWMRFHRRAMTLFGPACRRAEISASVHVGLFAWRGCGSFFPALEDAFFPRTKQSTKTIH
jgi:hypothetical protein